MLPRAVNVGLLCPNTYCMDVLRNVCNLLNKKVLFHKKDVLENITCGMEYVVDGSKIFILYEINLLWSITL